MEHSTLVIKHIRNLRWILLTTIAFVWPFVFPQHQIPLGIAINTVLVISAVRLSTYERYGVIILPNLSVLLHGVLFGSMTRYMIVFTPFIWLANGLMVYTVSLLHQKYGIFISGVIGSVLKATLLFTVVTVLVSLHSVPDFFLISMGYMQIVTAVCGTCLAYSIVRIYESQDKRI